MDDFVAQIEEEAARRFVRFDRPLWRAWVAETGSGVAEGLLAAGAPPDEAHRVVDTWLRLASEGVGLGYLVPGALHAETFFGWAWGHLLPRLLPRVSADRRVPLLAELFNLGENLEAEPPWLQRVFLHVAASTPDAIEPAELIAAVHRRVIADPVHTLDAKKLAFHWVDLGAADPRFLPGKVKFVAPTVAVVFDRIRDGSDGKPPATQGLWLVDPVVQLGPMGDPGPVPTTTKGLVAWTTARKHDPRLQGSGLATTGNGWREVGVLETSQHVVVAMPLDPS